MRKYYSHSQMDLLSQCGLKYNFKYVQGIEKSSSSSALVFGSAIHKAIELFHKSLCDKQMSKKDLLDAFEKEWEFLIRTSKTPIVFKRGEQKGNLFEIGLDILSTYYKDHDGYPPPCMFLNDSGELVPAVEIDFTVDIPYQGGTLSKPISGKIDLITPNKRTKTSEIHIIDHKTSSEDYTQFKINTAVQLTLYAYAFRQLLKAGRFPYLSIHKEDAVGYNVFKKLESTKVRMDNLGEVTYIRKQIEEHDFDHMYNVYGMMDKAVVNGIFMPNYGRQCQWCDYKEECSEFKYK